MPLAISTGMGLNAYFTYNVVGYCKSPSLAFCPDSTPQGMNLDQGKTTTVYYTKALSYQLAASMRARLIGFGTLTRGLMQMELEA